MSAAEHWSFAAPKKVAIPAVANANWPRNSIDRFILSRLEAEGLEPAGEASKTTLIRRLSFDLLGLPPSPEEVRSFLDDTSPDAYEKLIDRLLASPHYGERQAQFWLDLARYADTDGYEFDQARPEMWRYRDWAVSAFNQNMPYDRFIRFQLAGDELAPDDPGAIIATGFNRLYPDMVDLNDQNLRRQNALNDITETTSAVFLGLTMGCARCHDHKTDPIKQSEFYALQAFFAPAQFRDDFVIASAEERASFEANRKTWESELARLRSQILRLETPYRSRIAEGHPPNLGDDAARAFAVPEAGRTPEETRLVFEAIRNDHRIKTKALAEIMEPATRKEWQLSLAQLENSLKTAPPPLPQARGLIEKPGNVPPTHILKRGDFYTKGAEVSPSFPRVLPGATSSRITKSSNSSGRRTALVDWLVREDHPLTARVMVNRLWQQHFHRGIVATPSDFGAMGDEPSHPELLDWLAIAFIANHWDIKAMHRLMVTSSTYRQGAIASEQARKLDPENVLLSRHSRSRLDGESLRDSLLSVSGRLNPEMGGPSIFPELPRELMKLSSKGAIWPVSPRPEDRNRRSLYVFMRRNLRFPMFEAFDKPDTNATCPKRAVTTIAPQALSMLNGTLANESAKALSERVDREVGRDPARRIERAYQVALGRGPDAEELKLALEFVKRSDFDDFCLALLNLNEFAYVE